MYERILLPTDMSEGVEEAIDHAIEVARRNDAELHVLYVVDTDVYSSYPGDEYVHEFEGLEHALEQAGRHAVEEISTKAVDAGITTVTELRHGIPHEEILQYMEEADVDLAVLGSKHRPDEYRRFLGSVARRVATVAQRPVTIVKTPVEPPEGTAS